MKTEVNELLSMSGSSHGRVASHNGLAGVADRGPGGRISSSTSLGVHQCGDLVQQLILGLSPLADYLCDRLFQK